MAHTNKEYKIITVTDLINVATDENIDNLLADLKGWIIMRKNLAFLEKIMSNDVEIVHKNPHIFLWVDDGKVGGDIQVNIA